MTTPDPEQMEQRLDDLEERTAAARRQAEEHGTLPPSEPEQTFIDPDADGRIDDEDEDPGATFGG
jgi:hypothetical protein